MQLNPIYRQYYFQLYRNTLRAIDVSFPSTETNKFLKSRLREEYQLHRETKDPARVEALLHRAHAVMSACFPEDMVSSTSPSHT